MAATVFVRGAGGTIFEMDVPAEGSMARETWDGRLAKGELQIVDEAHWVEHADGTAHLVAGNAGDDEAGTTAEVPPTKWKKAELLAWLEANGVDHDPKSTNAVLAGVVEAAQSAIDAADTDADAGDDEAGTTAEVNDADNDEAPEE